MKEVILSLTIVISMLMSFSNNVPVEEAVEDDGIYYVDIYQDSKEPDINFAEEVVYDVPECVDKYAENFGTIDVLDEKYVRPNMLNVRTHPTTDSSVKDEVYLGEKISIISDEEDGWVRAETSDGTRGYVKAEYLTDLRAIGQYEITYYCPCAECCTIANNKTASGVYPRVNHTIAIDRNLHDFGEKLVIDGQTYTCEDTGSAIVGRKIDIFVQSHSEAKNLGKTVKTVYAYE